MGKYTQTRPSTLFIPLSLHSFYKRFTRQDKYSLGLTFPSPPWYALSPPHPHLQSSSRSRSRSRFHFPSYRPRPRHHFHHTHIESPQTSSRSNIPRSSTFSSIILNSCPTQGSRSRANTQKNLHAPPRGMLFLFPRLSSFDELALWDGIHWAGARPESGIGVGQAWDTRQINMCFFDFGLVG